MKVEDILWQTERLPRDFWISEYVLLTDEGGSESFEEAKGDMHNREWLHAKHHEMDSLHENHTHELTELPKEGNLEQVGL